MSSQRSFMQKRKKVIEQFLRKFTFKLFPFDPRLIFRPPKIPVTVIESHYISFYFMNFIPRKLYVKIEKKLFDRFWENELLNFLKLKFICFKFKIQNFTKTKKTSSYILPRNIPTDFEKNPNIGCRVTGVDRQTDRQTDRPTTRHGNRSSGPKNTWAYTPWPDPASPKYNFGYCKKFK